MFFDVKVPKEVEVINDRYCGENCPQLYQKYSECYLMGRSDMIELEDEVVFEFEESKYACNIRTDECRKLTGKIEQDGLPAYIKKLEKYERDMSDNIINQKIKTELEDMMNRINTDPIDYDQTESDEEFK